MTTAVQGPADLRVARRLADLESVIERGKTAFVEVGEALIEIRESKLYRLSYSTFDAYCKSRWGWSARYGQQLVDAATVVREIGPGVRIPEYEKHARALVPLVDQPEVMRDVWAGVIERAEQTDTPVTGPVIRNAVRDYIRGQAASSEAEIQQAAAGMTDEQRASLHPEMMRQRGELVRLIRDLGALSEPVAFAKLHGPYLPSNFLAEVAFATGWLEFFCDALEGKR